MKCLLTTVFNFKQTMFVYTVTLATVKGHIVNWILDSMNTVQGKA